MDSPENSSVIFTFFLKNLKTKEAEASTGKLNYIHLHSQWVVIHVMAKILIYKRFQNPLISKLLLLFIYAGHTKGSFGAVCMGASLLICSSCWAFYRCMFCGNKHCRKSCAPSRHGGHTKGSFGAVYIEANLLIDISCWELYGSKFAGNRHCRKTCAAQPGTPLFAYPLHIHVVKISNNVLTEAKGSSSLDDSCSWCIKTCVWPQRTSSVERYANCF